MDFMRGKMNKKRTDKKKGKIMNEEICGHIRILW